MNNTIRNSVASVMLTGALTASSTANAQLFKIINESHNDISVGMAYWDESCSSNYHNQLWTNVPAGDSRDVDIDLSNRILVTAITDANGLKTINIEGTGNLGRYDWDTPIAGSNQCALFGAQPQQQFGYAQFAPLADVCAQHGVSGQAGMVLRDDPSAQRRPSARVGCIVPGGGGGPVVPETEPHVE